MATRSQIASTSPHFVTTPDGVDLFCRAWGEGKPVVFLSGWALSSDMWAYQMLPMSRAGLRCIAYDRRGHGRSADPGRGYDYDTLGDDLAAVLERFDLRQVTLVGHSFSSGEMVRYLTRHGSARIERLAFVAPAATPCLARSESNPGGVEPSLFDARRDLIVKDFPRWLDENSGPYFVPDTAPGMVEWTKQTMLQTSFLAVYECDRAMAAADFRAELTTIDRPTLVIHGDRDASAPLELTGRPTARAIPRAVLEIYEGAPHGLYVTHAEALTHDLLAFAAGR